MSYRKRQIKKLSGEAFLAFKSEPDPSCTKREIHQEAGNPSYKITTK